MKQASSARSPSRSIASIPAPSGLHQRDRPVSLTREFETYGVPPRLAQSPVRRAPCSRCEQRRLLLQFAARMRATSSRSSTICACRFALAKMASIARWRRRSLTTLRFNRSAHPTSALRGVRSACDAIARTEPLSGCHFALPPSARVRVRARAGDRARML